MDLIDREESKMRKENGGMKRGEHWGRESNEGALGVAGMQSEFQHNLRYEGRQKPGPAWVFFWWGLQRRPPEVARKLA